MRRLKSRLCPFCGPEGPPPPLIYHLDSPLAGAGAYFSRERKVAKGRLGNYVS